MQILPYASDHEKNVQEFNERMLAGESTWQIVTDHAPRGLFRPEVFLIIDDDMTVRGSYILRRYEFALGDSTMPVWHYEHPVSEGIINPDYNFVGLRLLTNALSKNLPLFCLGIGSPKDSLAVMLAAMRWSIAIVPFFFRIINPTTVLKNIGYLRSSRWKRFALDALANTGIGWAGLKTARLFSRRKLRTMPAEYEEIQVFEEWADDIWNECKGECSFIAVRNAHTLNRLYPADDNRFIRLKLTVESRIVGWAVLLATSMSGHRHFGNMKVGSLVDCLAAPGFAVHATACVREYLEGSGVDLIVTNQSHSSWCNALLHCGFMQGPSNFLFTASPNLAAKLKPFQTTVLSVHINRGDGEGPINL